MNRNIIFKIPKWFLLYFMFIAIYVIIHLIDLIYLYTIILVFNEMVVSYILIFFNYIFGILRYSIPYIVIYFLLCMFSIQYLGYNKLLFFGIDVQQFYQKKKWWIFYLKEYIYIIVFIFNILFLSIIWYWQQWILGFLLIISSIFYIILYFYVKKRIQKYSMWKTFNIFVNTLVIAIFSMYFSEIGLIVENHFGGLSYNKVSKVTDYFYLLLKKKEYLLMKLKEESEESEIKSTWWRLFYLYKNQKTHERYIFLKNNILKNNILNEIELKKNSLLKHQNFNNMTQLIDSINLNFSLKKISLNDINNQSNNICIDKFATYYEKTNSNNFLNLKFSKYSIYRKFKLFHLKMLGINWWNVMNKNPQKLSTEYDLIDLVENFSEKEQLRLEKYLNKFSDEDVWYYNSDIYYNYHISKLYKTWWTKKAHQSVFLYQEKNKVIPKCNYITNVKDLHYYITFVKFKINKFIKIWNMFSYNIYNYNIFLLEGNYINFNKLTTITNDIAIKFKNNWDINRLYWNNINDQVETDTEFLLLKKEIWDYKKYKELCKVKFNKINWKTVFYYRKITWAERTTWKLIQDCHLNNNKYVMAWYKKKYPVTIIYHYRNYRYPLNNKYVFFFNAEKKIPILINNKKSSNIMLKQYFCYKKLSGIFKKILLNHMKIKTHYYNKVQHFRYKNYFDFISFNKEKEEINDFLNEKINGNINTQINNYNRWQNSIYLLNKYKNFILNVANNIEDNSEHAYFKTFLLNTYKMLASYYYFMNDYDKNLINELQKMQKICYNYYLYQKNSKEYLIKVFNKVSNVFKCPIYNISETFLKKPESFFYKEYNKILDKLEQMLESAPSILFVTKLAQQVALSIQYGSTDLETLKDKIEEMIVLKREIKKLDLISEYLEENLEYLDDQLDLFGYELRMKKIIYLNHIDDVVAKKLDALDRMQRTVINTQNLTIKNFYFQGKFDKEAWSIVQFARSLDYRKEHYFIKVKTRAAKEWTDIQYYKELRKLYDSYCCSLEDLVEGFSTIRDKFDEITIAKLEALDKDFESFVEFNEDLKKLPKRLMDEKRLADLTNEIHQIKNSEVYKLYKSKKQYYKYFVKKDWDSYNKNRFKNEIKIFK